MRSFSTEAFVAFMSLVALVAGASILVVRDDVVLGGILLLFAFAMALCSRAVEICDITIRMREGIGADEAKETA